MRYPKTVAFLTGLMLLIMCSCTPQATPVDSSGQVSLEPASSDVQSELDWQESDVYRNAKYADYMSMEEYDALFGMSGMLPSDPDASPDGKSIMYFYPAEFEEESALYRYDLASKTVQTVLTQQDIGTTQSIKWFEWQKDSTLLLVIGYRYGTISPGGAVYLLNPDEAPNLRLLYTTGKEAQQVLRATLDGTTLSMTIAEYDEEFLNYTETSRIVEVDPAKAPIAQFTSPADAADGTLAVILNFPDDEVLRAYPNLEVYEHDQSGESLLLVPSHEGTRIMLEEMIFDEKKENFVPSKVLYDKVSQAGYALHIKAIRPEGGPQLRLTVAYSDRSVEYYITYNGNTGTPEREELK